MAPLYTARRMRLMAAGLAGLLTLSGCATDGRGYGGVDVGMGVGYGSGYGYDPYYGPAGAYGGWYDDYYYPGGGYYVFDRGGRRHRWNDRQRAYWQQHHGSVRPGEQGGRPPMAPERRRYSRDNPQLRPQVRQADPGNVQRAPRVERSQERSVAPARAPREPSAAQPSSGGGERRHYGRARP
ncbi:hypothetical protein BH10PSE12_BH10PSE12_27890 [soil metagenome]